MDTNSISGHTQNETEQQLSLINRKRLAISGITEVLRFDDTAAMFDTVCGRLAVRGENLRVESMDVETGNVILKGTICALGYTGDGNEKSGVLGKLFR